jgi:uncharacterized membrane protein YbhN (UPF0104 family)
MSDINYIQKKNTQIKNDVKTSNLLMTSIGIIAVGILCVFIEIVNDKIGSGLFISCIIVVCGLSLYSLLILLLTFKTESSKSNNKIKILLIINSIINFVALIYFIVIFSKKSSELMKIDVLEYIKPYLKGFLYTIVIIIVVNIFIYHYLKQVTIKMEHVISLVIFLGVFGLVECIIEIVFLNIISKILNNVTDG